MYMVSSSLLFNNLDSKGFCNIKIDDFKPIRNITNKNWLPVFYTGNIMELKTIYRVIAFIQYIFHKERII